MKQILKLETPILINGVERTELTYDPMEITAEQFAKAAAMSAEASKSAVVSFKVRESDYAFHQFLGMMAVIAVNPDIAIEDLKKIKGYDALSLADIGLVFTLRRSGAASSPKDLEEQSENIPESSTAESEN